MNKKNKHHLHSIPINITATARKLIALAVLLLLGCEKYQFEVIIPIPTSYRIEMPFIETRLVTNITTNTAISGGEITVKFSGVKPEVIYSSIDTKGVCWSTHKSPSILDNNTTNGAGYLSFESQVFDLIPGTTYYIRAYVCINMLLSAPNYLTTLDSATYQKLSSKYYIDGRYKLIYGDEKSFTTLEQ